ncbi:MAG: RNA polymerase sigma factor [Acidimicrobiales bacterium]
MSERIREVEKAVAGSPALDGMGGEAIFDAIYREQFVSLLRVAYLLTGSKAVAEDAVHDVFVRCRDRLADLVHPPSYLRAAVVNACRSHHRRTQRRQPVSEEPAHLPVELLELRDALDRLSDRRRVAVTLRYFCDMDFEEIAVVLQCRPGTVRSLVHRGVNDLKGVLR